MNRQLLVLLSLLAGLLGATPASPAAAADPVVAVVGDIACDPASGYFAGRDPNKCQHRATAALVKAKGVARVLIPGDAQYEHGARAAFDGSFDASGWGDLEPITCAVPGNHEYHEAGAAGFFDYFGPLAGTTGRVDCPVPGAPTWTVTGLNTTDGCRIKSCSATSKNTTFLREQLAKTPRCELAYWHHPRWSAEKADTSAVQPFHDAFYKGRGDVIVNGHSHTYERFGKQTNTGAKDTTNGYRMFVSGLGGKDHRPFDDTPTARSIKRITGTHAVLFLTLHSSSYDWQLVAVDGRVLDSGTGAPCRY